MKVSAMSRDKVNLNSMNLSNEFVEQNLNDQVQYKIALKNLSEMNNDIAERFINKERVIREKTSLGGFRIPMETLKKRVNPSESFKEHEIHGFSYNPYNYNARSQTSQGSKYKNFGEPLIDENLIYDPEKDLGSNLIDVIDKEVEKLKKESEEHLKAIEMSKSSKLNLSPEIDESKVITQYLSYNPDRVQAIKHVATQFKPEYMSLEELQKLKEEHAKKMIQIENEFYDKKKRDEENLNRMYKLGEDRNYDKLYNMEMRHNESRKLTTEELNEIVKNEEDFIKRNHRNDKKRMKERSKSLKGIRRVGVSVDHLEKPLDPNEQRYVKKYANYLMKKKIGKSNAFNNEEGNDEDESWNTTKIKSKNKNGVVNRKDGLPGHLDNEDYSMYYYSINSNTPRSLSIKSVTHSRSASKKIKKKNLNRSLDINKKRNTQSELYTESISRSVSRSITNSLSRSYSNSSKRRNSSRKSKEKSRNKIKQKSNKNINHKTKQRTSHKKSNHKLNKSYDNRNKHHKTHSTKNSNHLNTNQKDSNKLNMNSHLAFIKLIYNLLDKQKQGIVHKQEIARDLNLEEHILQDLGFENLKSFQEGLETFPSQKEDYMTEQELIGFLLSRSDLAEEYLYNFKNNQADANMQEENNYEFNNYNQQYYDTEQNQNAEMEYPGMSTNQMDFLQYPTTQERLEKLRESFNGRSSHKESRKSKPDIKQFNRSLTRSLKDKIKSDNKVKVTYKDYSNFLNKYQHKGELNFTIPKPFEFLKKDYSSKKMEKIQEILEERKRKEDEILGYRFRANELKREIFISQFENVIEAEKTKRKYRTEKLKEKIIQEMKPFSFYEQDERKFKEKLQKIAEPPQFPPFKANAVPWTSQVTMYDDILKKMEVERQSRIEQRAMETQKMAKLPPRMEMHEKKKKQQEQEMKLLEKTQTLQRSKSFRANAVPNFAKAHESFIKTLEKKKANAKPTEPIPFNFHEPKKKASLRGYLDKENDPQSKNPQFKRNITEIIQKIQQKPKIEPASTKALNLLMATRRKELEERQRKEEEKLLEEKMRKEKQERLKERVINSKALVDNSKALEEKRQKQQEDFKKSLQEKKQAYQQDLARRLQRVYNKPLMFETTTNKVEKFSMNKNIKEKLNDVLYNNIDEPSEVNIDDQLYEGKFDN